MFPFFADAKNLETLTPRWLRFEMLTPEPIAMAPGVQIDYRLSWHGVPLHWSSVIVAWEPPYRFEDLQLKGPYKLWHHTHRFASVAGGTKIMDSVLYSLPLGMLGRSIHALSVRKNLERIFAYRSKRVSEIFRDDRSGRARAE